MPLEDYAEETEELETVTEEMQDTDSEDFSQFCRDMQAVSPDISEDTLQALWTNPAQRDYMQTELVDIARNPDYVPQRSLLTDPDTGLVVTDENGEFTECPRNTKGAQRPDGMYVDDTGVHLLESKNYHNLNNLMQNIREQTEKREAGFGSDVDITYSVAPNFTIEEAERLHDYVENKLGHHLEFQLK